MPGVNSARSILECIGSTPLIYLRTPSEQTGCEIFGKAEFLNPGGSVKDRAALGIIRQAQTQGRLKPGGIVVEGTAGNTGIGIALVADVLGYRSVIVMPNTQSREKVDALRAYGARVAQIPAVPYRNPNHFVHVARRLAAELADSEPSGAIFADQFDNTANRDFHFQTTGPEIWRDTGGKLDGFVCAAGTGGTLAGVGAYLKQANPDITIALSDPGGSGLHHFYAFGEIKVEGSSMSEGIGNSRITGNLKDAPVDRSYSIPDLEALPWVYGLLQREGLCVGSSSGVNVAGAVRLARELGPGHTIVTILCDAGTRYIQRLFNPEFLRGRELPAPDWLEQPELDLERLFVAT